MDPVYDDANLPAHEQIVWQPPHPKFRDRVWLHISLFVFTIVSTTLVGAAHYAGFLTEFSTARMTLPFGALLVRGLWYSVTILAILGFHELGHYLACRYYDVDASLPFFLPMPFLFSGTLGAFIRIREQIPRKHMLFDIGVAGPIAGFVVAVPALFLGLAMSTVGPPPAHLPPGSAELGEPLVFRFAQWVVWGKAPDNYLLNLHPVGFAAWFGLLATALNLIPVGQLDGGHISYAVFGRASSQITIVMIVLLLGLGLLTPSWLVWSGLLIVMLYFFGRHHPTVVDEDVPLDRTRMWLAFAAAVILVLCFTPSPMRPLDVIAK